MLTVEGLRVPVHRKRARSSRLTCAVCRQRAKRGSTVVGVRLRDHDGELALGWAHEARVEPTEPTLFESPVEP